MWFFMHLLSLNLAWIRNKCDNKQAAICLCCCYYANMNRNVIDRFEHLVLFSARFRRDCFDSSVRVPIPWSKKRVDYLQIWAFFNAFHKCTVHAYAIHRSKQWFVFGQFASIATEVAFRSPAFVEIRHFLILAVNRLECSIRGVAFCRQSNNNLGQRHIIS